MELKNIKLIDKKTVDQDIRTINPIFMINYREITIVL